METALQHYEGQINSFNRELYRLKRRRSSFAWMRLGSIIAIFFGFYLLWQSGIVYVVIASAVLLFIFIRLVYADLTNHEEIRFTKRLIELYEKEIAALHGAHPFANGSVYLTKDHPYSADLDIFGEGSLFQYVNRTTSEPGADRLASYLSEKSSIEVITQRQKAVAELSKQPGWMKKMQTAGTLKSFTNQAYVNLSQWVAEENKFLQFKPWRWLRYLLPAIALAAFFLYLNDTVELPVLLITLLFMAIIAWQINKVVAPIHRKLDEMSKPLHTLSETILLIENQSFESPLLQGLQQQIILKQSRASVEIRRITRLLERLDVRYNMALSPILNLFLMWNLQQILDLEKWKIKHKDHLKSWLHALAEFEALNSLANFYFNHPAYIFPEVLPDYFIMEGMDVGHPLIPGEKRVDNPVHLPAKGKLMLVTGSNMAGKSTYLRSIGVNCVLAFCGAPVCASTFRISLVSILSSMRISDNLQESTSTFYAELKKLKVVIDRVNARDRVLILLDEILRGTNSMDRHTGSKALIRQLIEKQSTGVIATHDLELAKINEPFAENILNYHFDVQVSDDELYFDYKLKPGICKSMNASILMKKIGIDV